VRRIGEVIREQVALYGTLTGAEPARPRAERPVSPPAADEPGSQVLPLRRKAG
jgi:hypothetical protein